ncbi:hypothetical protein BC831DRAFT_476843 [Entophlyctis helioformis]|nr:hypothetical protein BC831DRAFT_476843 [Entophlyctis helioformis]
MDDRSAKVQHAREKLQRFQASRSSGGRSRTHSPQPAPAQLPEPQVLASADTETTVVKRTEHKVVSVKQLLASRAQTPSPPRPVPVADTAVATVQAPTANASSSNSSSQSLSSVQMRAQSIQVSQLESVVADLQEQLQSRIKEVQVLRRMLSGDGDALQDAAAGQAHDLDLQTLAAWNTQLRQRIALLEQGGAAGALSTASGSGRAGPTADATVQAGCAAVMVPASAQATPHVALKLVQTDSAATAPPLPAAAAPPGPTAAVSSSDEYQALAVQHASLAAEAARLQQQMEQMQRTMAAEREITHALRQTLEQTQQQQRDFAAEAAARQEQEEAARQQLVGQVAALSSARDQLVQELTNAHEVMDMQHAKLEALLEQQQQQKQQSQQQQSQQQQQQQQQPARSPNPPTPRRAVHRSGSRQLSRAASVSALDLSLLAAFADSTPTSDGGAADADVDAEPAKQQLRITLRGLLDEHARLQQTSVATLQRLDEQMRINSEIKKLIVHSSVGQQTAAPPASGSWASLTMSRRRTGSSGSAVGDAAASADGGRPESLLERYNDALVRIGQLQQELAATRQPASDDDGAGDGAGDGEPQ